MNSHLTTLDRIDRFGTVASFACAVHCAITPVATTILPLVGISFLADERTERIFLAVSLALATASVCWGVRIHKQRRILVIFGTALFLVFSGRRQFAGIAETLMVVAGALLFVCGHLVNRGLCRQCSACDGNR